MEALVFGLYEAIPFRAKKTLKEGKSCENWISI